MRMFRSILSIIALLFCLSPAFAASEKISDLTAGTPPYDPSTLMELSVPNGSGGWNSRKGQLSDVIGTRVSTVTLNSAALTHLHSSPAVLIPAPGAGNIIYPLGISFSYVFGTTPYVSSDNAEAVTYANGVAGNIDLFSSMGAMATAFTGSVSAGPIIGIFDSTGGLPIVYTASVNQALVLGEPVADATGGDGTVTFTIIYAIVPAP